MAEVIVTVKKKGIDEEVNMIKRGGNEERGGREREGDR